MGSTILENDFEHFRSKLSLFWPRNGGFARSAAAVLDHRILEISGKNVYFLFTGPLDTIIKFAKKCFPPWRGAHFRFSSFFIKSHWKHKSNMPPSKKCFPLLWGAHFWFSRISTSSQSWCTSIVPFSKMCFPPSVGSTILLFIDFHNFAEDMQIEIACLFSFSDRFLEPLGVNFASTWVNFASTWANLGPA